MTFSEVLNTYLSEYDILLSDLSEKSGISKSMLSRMKNGKKEPEADSDLPTRLASAIAELAMQKKSINLSPDSVNNALRASLHQESFDMESIVSNINILINTLNIKVSDLSRHLNFDASYLSRIRSGKRRPFNVSEFCMRISDFVVSHYDSDLTILSRIVECPQNLLENPTSRRKIVYQWLTKQKVLSDNYVQSFLQKLDSFDLNEYIRALHFQEIATPPVSVPSSFQKDYYTLTGFMQAELDWLNATVQSSSMEPVILYSDMPFEEMSKNPEFPKQWMSGIALLLKKGLHLHMIHHVNRQVSEMMLGLEGWIPLYMTGQVSPYYLNNYQDHFFHHFLRVSGSAALSGEAITGHHGDGQYHFSNCKEEVTYYRKRGKALLSKARPLMKIYRQSNAVEYQTFLQTKSFDQAYPHRSILSVPPIYTLSSSLLDKILTENLASEEEKEKICAYVKNYRTELEKLLQTVPVTDEISLMSEEDFRTYPVSLPLADLFPEKEYHYSYEDYLTHIELTKEFAGAHSNYRYCLNHDQPFRNIQIRMTEGRFVILSKSKSPAIHFVIHHPSLRQAIENMVIPIRD